jgi:hypothetical protein
VKIGAADGWLGLMNGRAGIRRSTDALDGAVQDVVSASVDALNKTAMEGRSVEPRPSLDEAILDTKRAEHAYGANVRVVRMSDEALESLIDLVASGREPKR